MGQVRDGLTLRPHGLNRAAPSWAVNGCRLKHEWLVTAVIRDLISGFGSNMLGETVDGLFAQWREIMSQICSVNLDSRRYNWAGMTLHVHRSNTLSIGNSTL